MAKAWELRVARGCWEPVPGCGAALKGIRGSATAQSILWGHGYFFSSVALHWSLHDIVWE